MSSAFKRPLINALARALEHLESLDSAPVEATATLEDPRTQLSKELRNDGIDAATVVDELVADTAGGIIGSAGGRFFGWVIGGSVPAAMAADWLTATWDQNAASNARGPAEAVIEEIAGNWLKDLPGLPATASAAFPTGSQMAHLTCLAAARNHLLSERGWDVELDGLAGAPPIRILTSTEYHGSIDRVPRLAGFGLNAIETLPADDQGRLWTPPVLENQGLRRLCRCTQAI